MPSCRRVHSFRRSRWNKRKLSNGLARTNKLFRTQYNRNHWDISDVCNTIFFLFFSYCSYCLSIDTPACACLWLNMRITIIYKRLLVLIYLCARMYLPVYTWWFMWEGLSTRSHYSFYRDPYRLKYRLSYRHRRRRPLRSRYPSLVFRLRSIPFNVSSCFPLPVFFRRGVLGRFIQDATVDRWTLSITF